MDAPPAAAPLWHGRSRTRSASRGCPSPVCAYFAGDLDAIEGIPVPMGGAVFERSVCADPRAIPAG